SVLTPQRAARVPEGETSRLHGAVGVRAVGGVAADTLRQARPPRAAGARPGSARSTGCFRRATYSRRGDPGRHLDERAAAGAGRRPRRLLRAGWTLAAGDPGDLAGARGIPCGAAAAPPVRG